MADEIDMANDQAEGLRSIALALVRDRAALTPKGTCHNCDSGVERGVIFCDAYCRDDYDKRKTYEAKTHR